MTRVGSMCVCERESESLENLHSIRERYPQTRKLSGWVGKKVSSKKISEMCHNSTSNRRKEGWGKREKERKRVRWEEMTLSSGPVHGLLSIWKSLATEKHPTQCPLSSSTSNIDQILQRKKSKKVDEDLDDISLKIQQNTNKTNFKIENKNCSYN